MEERKGKILMNKAGGNASAKGRSYRVALPPVWMNALGISENSREITLQFDGESIVIRPASSAQYDVFLQDARRLGHDLLLLHFYDGDALCTKICADRTARRLVIQNETDDILATAFGVNTAPDWSDFEDFLTSHCVSKDRDGIREYLSALGIDGYEPLNIIRKTGGRMAEDHQWIKILEG
jgi:hypothetical protein